MSALRQAVVVAACLLLLQIVGAVIAGSIVRSEFNARIEDELRTRFRHVAEDIEANGFDREGHPNSTTEVFYFQAEQPSEFIPPEGIFELRGVIEDDRWDRWDFWNRAADDPLSLDDDHWFFFVGEVGGSVLAIGTNQGQSTSLIGVVPLLFFLIGVAVSLIALSVGAGFSVHNQNRLNQILNALRRVAQGHFESRVALPNSRDDLDDLAHNIDHTLVRLEGLFNQSRNNAANIAHDLKTPIARLRLRLENVLLSDDLNEAKENAELGLKQADHIIAVFESFLSIARLESGDVHKRFAPVSFADIAEDVAQAVGPVAEDAGFEFVKDFSGDAVVQGDAILLKQMLINLIENAIRHTPRGTRITLVANDLELGVFDDGPGIPQESLSEVTKPSVRLESSRTSPGAGLGLALVKAIAEAHGADLVLSNNPEGSQHGLYVRARFF